MLGDVEAQPRQPLQQVPLALLGGVGHKPDGHRGAAQPGGDTGANWTQAPPVLTSVLLSGAKNTLKAVGENATEAEDWCHAKTSVMWRRQQGLHLPDQDMPSSPHLPQKFLRRTLIPTPS